MGETTKATTRRVRERFFEKYCRGRGLDIGPDNDPITPYVQTWTWDNGDAVYMDGLPDEGYEFVYSSHVLEDVERSKLVIALRNWWRLVVRGGFLIVVVPHRDLYEKKKTLPSRWNEGHKVFWLMDRNERPDTYGILPMIRASLTDYELIRAVVCDDGYVYNVSDPAIHAEGEYSIEIVLRKARKPW
jgi:hypothetical protein